jgi:hypothetical protein
MSNQFKLYQQVVLSRDLPEENLQKGDVATIVEIIVKENKTGYCLEFFDNEGNTLKVIIVSDADISEVKPHSIVNYREMEAH